MREKKEGQIKNGEVERGSVCLCVCECVCVAAVMCPPRLCVDEDGRTAGMSWAKGNCVSISGSANKHQ